MPPLKRPVPKQKQGTNPQKKSSNHITIGIIVVIIVLLILAAGGYFYIYPRIIQQKKATTNIIISDTIKITPIDTIPKIVESEIVVQQESTSSVPKGYYIIVGSFREKNNAENLLKKVRKDIELNVYYFEEIGLYRASAGHYDNIHKAYNDAYSIKDIDG